MLVNLAEYFYAQGYRVTIVTQYRSENEYPVSEGIRRVLSDIEGDEIRKSRAVNFCGRFMKLRGIWKREKPDLILSFIGKNNIMAILTSRFLHIPVVVSVRGEPEQEYYSLGLRLAARYVFRLAEGIVLQTKSCLTFFPEAVNKKAIILKNSLNPAFIKESYEGEREKQIVAVGRLDANKNHEMIIRAFAEISDRYPDYKLIIYGEGPLRQKLTEYADDLGLSEQVELPGAISNVAEAIYKASAFILSSYSEGMPNTLLEAMALGIPVISTDCPPGGPRELIVHGENGLLVPPGDWEKLAENLQKLLDNIDYAKKMGRNASKVKEEFNPEIINRAWKNYLEKIIQG
ncbi:glycosyltransferase involved in cell wall biosynthesis [Kineothrix alysoides]|uniref:Glycosyltransferase involved in cell wall biosynthesis n=1 Tax=Kineothrix alysoides TaxID=1469948 RepID=A0A4R1R228_9FIRM|nr:glycosyltransferase involved in cell wall biosynthesis [Kineothrix alysoides]